MLESKKPQHIIAALLVIALLVAWPYVTLAIYNFFAHALPSSLLSPFEIYSAFQDLSGDRRFVLISRLSMAACAITAITLLVAIYQDRRSLHGSAQFATESQITKAGLFSSSGLIIGKFKDKFLVFSEPVFALLAAPTRSGKGVGVVIPNLLNWQQSMVGLDVKLENFQLTSKFRQKILKQSVYLFNPFATNRRSHRWNPLDSVSRDPFLMPGDVLQIAQIFYPSKESDRNRFFTDQAQNLFFGIALYLLETNHPRCSMGEIYRQGAGYDKPLAEHLTDILQTYKGLSRTCRDALNRVLSCPPETLGNIKSTFDSALLIFANPLVDAATSASDFRLDELRKKKMSVYFGITPNRLDSASRLINLFFTQAIGLNTGVLPEDDPSLKYQCLFVDDEFTAFGRVSILIKSVSFIAGYGLKLLTIVQSIPQLESPDLYTRSEVENFVENHKIKILFPPESEKSAKEMSASLGTYTMKSTSVSSNSNGHWLTVNGNSSSGTSQSDQKRALMMAQELKQMSPTKSIIDKQGVPPVLCEKIRYYEEPVFIDRLKQVSPSLKKLGRQLPTEEQLKQARRKGELAAEVPELVFPGLSTWQRKDEEEMTDAQIEAAAALLAQRLPDYDALGTLEDFHEVVGREFARLFPNLSPI